MKIDTRDIPVPLTGSGAVELIPHPKVDAEPPPIQRRRSSMRTVRTVVLYAALIVMAIPFAVPTIWMITSSFKPVNEIFQSPPTIFPREWTLDGYHEAFEFLPFGQAYANSLYIAATVTVLTLVIASLAGYGFARISFPGRNLLFVITLVGLLVPVEVTIVPLFQAFRQLGLVNSHVPLIIIPAFGTSAVLGTFIMRQFFIALPTELEDAARIDGLGRLRIWWYVALPLARPALSAVAILTFLASWNMYLEPTVFITTPELFTLPQALNRYADAYGAPMWNTQLAAAAMTVIPVLVVFLIAQRQFVEGIAHSGLKG
ncbi:carbohydrate ABC transporter permease [Microbacterium sp. zg.Y909]|uniref:carbohydrate ABC transporter permease n=1 Tax=Microbacterium sp. zg.Y909 TaxID=2969413 RepID=UPI00214C9704|nr:carbohydrate ABC transporter permease [Microbacterium sp. zg.Y909]MCR2824970.1 carbohydrate ABC transporter permease [Microbacterium sp. zg.Y909]